MEHRYDNNTELCATGGVYCLFEELSPKTFEKILHNLFTLFATVGIITNFIVVLLLLTIRQRVLVNITNLFVLALAVSDSIQCAINLPIYLGNDFYNISNEISYIECVFFESTPGIPVHFSCLTILLIAIDRYRIIVYPLLARMTSFLAILLIFFVLVISIVMVLPIAFIYQWNEYTVEKGPTNITIHKFEICNGFQTHPVIVFIYSCVVFIVQYAVPLTCTAFLYARIYHRLQERRFRKRDVERKRRTNKILIAIVICFTVTWTPRMIHLMYIDYVTMIHHNKWYGKSINHSVENFPWLDSSKINYHDDLELLFKLIALSSCCINPWLYGLLNDSVCNYSHRMRRRFSRLFRHRRRQIQKLCYRYFRKCQKSDSEMEKGIYFCQCFGFYFALRTGFHSRSNQIARLKREDSKQFSRFAFNSSIKWDGSLPGKVTSKNSHSGGGSGCKGRNSKGSGGNGAKVGSISNGGKEQDGGNSKLTTAEQVAIQMHQSNRSSIARSSYASYATLSMYENSTKRTSLLPSSFGVVTPRGSFLYPPGAPPNLNYQEIQMGNTLHLPQNQAFFRNIPMVDADDEVDDQLEEFTVTIPIKIVVPSNKNNEVVTVESEKKQESQESVQIIQHRRSSSIKNHNLPIPFDIVTPFEFMSDMILEANCPKKGSFSLHGKICPTIEESSNETSSQPIEQDCTCPSDENLSDIQSKNVHRRSSKSSLKKVPRLSLKPVKEEQLEFSASDKKQHGLYSIVRKSFAEPKRDDQIDSVENERESRSEHQKEDEESEDGIDDVFAHFHKIVLAEEEQKKRRQSKTERDRSGSEIYFKTNYSTMKQHRRRTTTTAQTNKWLLNDSILTTKKARRVSDSPSETQTTKKKSVNVGLLRRLSFIHTNSNQHEEQSQNREYRLKQ